MRGRKRQRKKIEQGTRRRRRRLVRMFTVCYLRGRLRKNGMESLVRMSLRQLVRWFDMEGWRVSFDIAAPFDCHDDLIPDNGPPIEWISYTPDIVPGQVSDYVDILPDDGPPTEINDS